MECFRVEKVTGMAGGGIVRVLTIDRTETDAEPLIDTLRSTGYSVFHKHVPGAAELSSELAAQEWDLLLCGKGFELVDAAEAVRCLQEVRARTAVIVVYDEAEKDEQACVVEALQAGASDAVSRGNSVHLQLVVNREIKRLALLRAHEKAERAYVEMRERCLVLLESSRDAIAYVHQGMHVYANTAYAKTFGYENLEELFGMPIMNMILPDKQEAFKKFLRCYSSKESHVPLLESTCINASGKEFDVNMELARVVYEGEECLQVIVRPLVKEVEEAQSNILERYALPKLCDGPYFLSALGKASSEIESIPASVLYVEIDDFYSLRQRIGVEATETVVLRVGSLLEKCAPKQSLIARFADHALALLLEAQEPETGLIVAEEIRRRVAECPLSDLMPGGGSSSVTCSTGIAFVLEQTGNGGAFLDNARGACRTAMTSGGNRVEIWKAASLGDTIGSPTPASLVGDALESNRVSLVFQPIVSLQGDSTAMYEADPRALDAEGNPVNEEQFFSDLKELNTATKLDEWVVEAALTVLLEQQKQQGDIRLFLRLSDHAFRNELLLLFVREKLRSAKLSGQSLTLQISEKAALGQTKNVRAFLSGLKPIGCRSAVEHVGRTLNGLDHLKKLPVDYFKLDRSLCGRMLNGTEGQKSVAGIVQLAKTIGVQTIATGVDEADCLALLWQSGVDFAQGRCIQEASEVLQYDFSNED